MAASGAGDGRSSTAQVRRCSLGHTPPHKPLTCRTDQPWTAGQLRTCCLGFRSSLPHEVWPKTRQQRCWVHKAANVLNKLPPSLQGKAKQDLHAIYEAGNRKAAEDAFDRFVAKYGAKYDKAVACLAKDREVLLAFY